MSQRDKISVNFQLLETERQRTLSRQSNQVIYRVSPVTKTTQVDERERERERKPAGVGVQGDETISVYYVYRTTHLRHQQLDDVVDVDSSLISLSVLASISPFYHHPLSL